MIVNFLKLPFLISICYYRFLIFFLSLSIKLTVSFFASKTPLATFTGLIYSSHFALTGFEFSLAPLAGLVGGVRNFPGG